MFGCVSPGFTKISNDKTIPTTVWILPLGTVVSCVFGALVELLFCWDWVPDVAEVVGEAVVVEVLVSFASVWAVDDGAELSGVGALEPAVVVGLLCTELVVAAVAGEDGVVRTLVGFTGLTGETGLVTLVGFVTDFTQLFDVVTQGCHTGLPYGFGHVEERVWIMLPV
jgi:hypothetical protein